ncbi:Replication_factor C [Hexamita inflata]|uniref:Subunit 1 n=1 Tax=Hexamita inflata TaxID=28002 RepID=A0AA86UQ51_9EUKA|nr:Replication factor C [Hexamita inflata]
MNALIPRGSQKCLENILFVRTGELYVMTDQQLFTYMIAYGAKLASSVTASTNFLIVGNAPGETKLKAAEKHNTPQITEDDFYNLIVKVTREDGQEPELVDYIKALKPLENVKAKQVKVVQTDLWTQEKLGVLRLYMQNNDLNYKKLAKELNFTQSVIKAKIQQLSETQ